MEQSRFSHYQCEPCYEAYITQDYSKYVIPLTSFLGEHQYSANLSSLDLITVITSQPQ
ncbi:hypothetical protein VCRA2120E57_1020001 [Vibrio crassostreae]|nr:hypothetical protein VCRA2120E57_1020001 [Vibrio crassostreae]